MTNLEKSALYQLIEQFGVSSQTGESKVTGGGYTLKYNVPQGFVESEYSDEEYKMYMDEDFNSINVSINKTSVDKYMKDLDEEYILTSKLYKNQTISDTNSVNINGKEYKLRGIKYNDEYSSYMNLYFAYKLDEEHCYVVEVESEDGKISMDVVKIFLDVNVQ